MKARITIPLSILICVIFFYVPTVRNYHLILAFKPTSAPMINDARTMSNLDSPPLPKPMDGVQTIGNLSSPMMNLTNAETSDNLRSFGTSTIQSSTQIKDLEILDNLSSIRDQLLNKVSSYDELHQILDKFRTLADTPTYADDSSANKLTTIPSGSIVVSYLWNPEEVIGEKYSSP